MRQLSFPIICNRRTLYTATATSSRNERRGHTIMDITLALHSSPRFSTWIWVPDWHLLVDAGDGASQQLGYKIRKIDTVVLTHSHRDHLGGLLQVINQRGEAGPFTLAHPVNGNSWRALE